MQRPGYTLVELLVVIAIMALVTTLAAPAAGHVIQAMTFRSEASAVAETLHTLQMEAIQTQQIVTVRSSSSDLMTTTGKSVYSSDILKIRTAEPITFYPDGTTDGGRVVLYDSSKELVIEISWLTGQIVVEAS